MDGLALQTNIIRKTSAVRKSPLSPIERLVGEFVAERRNGFFLILIRHFLLGHHNSPWMNSLCHHPTAGDRQKEYSCATSEASFDG